MRKLRRWLPAAAALLLMGCNSNSTSLWGQYFQIAKMGLNNSLGSPRITRAQAAAIPYASLGYQVGSGPEMILVLATDAGGQQIWTAASHVVLTIDAGRVVRTQKLGRDLGTVTPGSRRELPPPAAALSGPVAYTRLADFPDMGIYGALLNCRMANGRAETISILGSALATMRVMENCDAPGLGWSFIDTFWIDAKSGFVWRSIQHVHPKLDELHIEIFRPPG